MKSLRGRLMTFLLAGIGLLLVAGVLVLHTIVASRLRRDFDAGLVAELRSLATLTEQQNGEVWLEAADEVELTPERQGRPAYYQLLASDGTVLARSPNLAGRNLPRVRGPLDRPRLLDLTLPDGRAGRLAAMTFHPRNEELMGQRRPEVPFGPAIATLAVARDRTETDAFIRFLRVLLGLFVAALLAGVATLVALSLRVGLAPLEELAGRLGRMGPDSLGEVVPAASAPSELAPVVERLNGLLARVKDSVARERMFGANLAHELRTPLAELRALAEVDLEWPDDAGSRTELLEEVRAIGLQMERIVVNLLALARCDGGQQTVAAAELSLAELVASCWSGVAPQAAERGVTLRSEVPPGLRIVSDREKLELVLANLFANAVDYGRPASQVTCSAAAADGRFALRVGNETDLLTPEDVPHVFDRFWRKDPARSSAGKHVGLGLALVAALCALLGLTVQAQLDADRLFAVTLEGRVA